MLTAVENGTVDELRNLVATLSADYSALIALVERFLFGFSIEDFFLVSGKSGEKTSIGSHLIFTMISRSVSWMDRQNLERPRAAGGWVGQCVAVLHVGPRSSPRDLATDPLWFLLVPSPCLSPRWSSPSRFSLAFDGFCPPWNGPPFFTKPGFRRTLPPP